MAIYRIAQEAMSNIAKHANASSLTVALTAPHRRVDLSVADDGYGFDRRILRPGPWASISCRSAPTTSEPTWLVASQPDIGTSVDVVWHCEPSRERFMTADAPIRILVVDDHKVVRKGSAPSSPSTTTSNSSAKPGTEKKPSSNAPHSRPTSSSWT